MTRLIGIVRECDPGCGGGCQYLIIPDNLDINKCTEDWRKWYDEVYTPAKIRNITEKYISFTQWLIEKGAKKATDDDIILLDEP